VRLDNINVSCNSEKNSATNLFGVSSIRLFSSLVCYDDNYFCTDFRNVGEFVRGEFEYVQSFTSHREFRSVDTLDESL